MIPIKPPLYKFSCQFLHEEIFFSFFSTISRLFAPFLVGIQDSMRRNASTHKLISDPEDSVFIEEDENSNDSNDQNSQHSSDQDIRDQNFNR